MRAHQRIPTAALMVALAIGEPRNDLDRPPYDPFDLGERLSNQTLHLFKRLRRLHPIVTDTFEALGKDLLDHTPDKRVDLYRFAFHPFAFMGTVLSFPFLDFS